MKLGLLEAFNEARGAKRRACHLRLLDAQDEALVVDGERVAGPELSKELAEAVEAALRADKSRLVEAPEGRVFLEVANPPLRMLVVGAVHITQALAPMATALGYAVTVIDPRRAFATDERFPGVEMRGEWPDEALRDLVPDRRTAVVTLTHDPKLDDPALIEALNSEAFYVAALGSKRTHAGRLERLRERGFADEQLSRIFGPAGLDIGAVSPAEIALSVMAQATAALRKG